MNHDRLGYNEHISHACGNAYQHQ